LEHDISDRLSRVGAGPRTLPCAIMIDRNGTRKACFGSHRTLPSVRASDEAWNVAATGHRERRSRAAPESSGGPQYTAGTARREPRRDFAACEGIAVEARADASRTAGRLNRLAADGDKRGVT
jgi:hypothetical protein